MHDDGPFDMNHQSNTPGSHQQFNFRLLEIKLLVKASENDNDFNNV